MAFKIDFLDGDILRWSKAGDSTERHRDSTYAPSIYVAGAVEDLREIRPHLRAFSEVEDVVRERWRRGFRHDPEPVLRIDITQIDQVRTVASDISGWGEPEDYRLFNVDFSREFRYCLETETDPTPSADLNVLSLSTDKQELAREEGIQELAVDDDPVRGAPADVAATVETHIQKRDPDVLSVSSAQLLARIQSAGEAEEWDFQLGRAPGFQQLAGRSTYESYGRVGHSPARYNVPGRVIIDRSNSFFLDETNLSGALDLVSRSWKPLQELAWASIGNVLTAIQIREARERDVLVPWKAWRPELFKTMEQLDDADRGGFIFAPEVGIHEDVHELDFSSLYPNIIITRNISPETIRCACHRGREDVPELGYCICDEPGYLPDVLAPLVEDRDEIKAAVHEATDPERIAELEGQSDAIKWILVSCFGYQGFSNAKFGRIEAHEAINAYAREIMLTAKEAFERGGWRVVHGIVDSIWVTAAEEDPKSLDTLAKDITAEVGIRLEYESAYDWVAFVPQRNSDAGALTKYFGRVTGEDEYKYRGIECRQDSTPEFIAEAQRELIRLLDRTRSPEAVCDRASHYAESLRRGHVDANRLYIDNRVSKQLDNYSRQTRNVAALQRAELQGAPRHPGQHVEYVVVNDEASSSDRVRIRGETVDRYDDEYYRRLLVRATESILAPLGWNEQRIRQHLSSDRVMELSSY